ncbi:uncharacterized protein DUF742 [Streptomyces sp. 1114.5]|uniref:DUF742 domain-containing protein n=1 Tax=Streptomyces sp. 1114.5 TaxID=1938830 RepID=UPI000F161484|nr:uncharacterized protein DUF742 [Streptomyces sp. 1114.5]
MGPYGNDASWGPGPGPGTGGSDGLSDGLPDDRRPGLAPHWSEIEDAEAEDETGVMVRPYTITRGRTAPERDDLTLITVLTTVEAEAEAALARGSRAGARGLQPEHRLILERCRRPAAVAEVSAGLDLPVSVTKILLGDLVAQGLLRARAPLSVARAAGGVDLGLLTAVREGLRRL